MTLPLLESVIVTVPSSHWTMTTVLLFFATQFGVADCANGAKNSRKSNILLTVVSSRSVLV
ncbi:hypothetical protein O5819_27650, partial [Escherichia coli]|nr:hypothetical protein [Escherichia coli]